MAETKKMGIYEKLMTVQQNLKAPKNQYNSFGKYKYRSCEDILEGLKPCLKEVKAAVTIDDEIVELHGCNRVYVKATAHFRDAETGEEIINTAYARESQDKKGMDDSQVTGATSSYARKYALNGLFMIDDTKDADTDESKNESDSRTKTKSEMKGVENQNITQVKADAIKERCKNDNLDVNYILKKCHVDKIENLTEKQAAFLAHNWDRALKGEL